MGALDEPDTCSGKGCRAAATHALLWNNPKIHTPERRKVWLACEEHLEPLRSFILSGGTPAAAHLHVARTVVRRAERSAWAAFEQHHDTMNKVAITYLNRLSDLVFILARHANREQGDVLWVPGGER